MQEHSSPTTSETRRSLRISENFGVRCRIKETQTSGPGKIVNISSTGLLLEAQDPAFSESKSGIFQLDSFLHGPDNFLPHEGRLVWSQKRNHSRVLCGIEFVNISEPVLIKLRERIQRKIMERTRRRKIKSVVGVSLCAVLMLLVGSLISQQMTIYQSMQNSNDLMNDSFEKQAALTRSYAALYQQTSQMLASVRQELDTTRSVLQQTETLLTETKDRNEQLQNQLASIQAHEVQFFQGREDLEKQIALLHDKNTEFAGELGQLKSQMRAFEGDIRSIDEGKAVISLFKNRLKLVKTKIQYLKREVYYAREAAQKERDRVLSLKGNHGYFVKNGRSFKPHEKLFGKEVEIDVSFIE